MPTINVHTPFDFAVDGNRVITVPAGEQVVSERCALVAVEHLKVAELCEDKSNARPGNRKKPPAS